MSVFFEHPHILPVYRRNDVVMVRGEGVYLYDDGGKEYLDFASGIATNALGHNHPAMQRALIEQAGQLWHCSNMFRNKPLEDFATLLCGYSGLDKVFFCSAGTEAVEAALKTIRRYHYVRGDMARTWIVAVEGAFHGRTTGALAACSNPASKQGFMPLMEGVRHVPFHDMDAIEALPASEVAAIMLETVQGEGGVRVHNAAYLQALRAWCDRHGVLLFLDEIQCGYGRTGQLFAYETAVIRPDIVTVAKGIGGGFPLAAMLCSNQAAQGMQMGTHGSTYGSNPLACAVGLAVLKEIMAEGFLSHVQAMGVQLTAMLDEVVHTLPQFFVARRGVGLMQGLVLQDGVDKHALTTRLREGGVLVAPAVSNVLRILPPLIIGEAHIAEAQETLMLL
jgi:acetylornithine/N-succinyldiaminopimelate aminotransferase